MGKIDLGRERGVRVSDAPLGGQNFGGYSGVGAGLSDSARAADSLARGMAHLGRVFGEISHDMAETRNAVDFSDYRVRAFKINQEHFIDKMESDMRSGAINSRETFEAAYKKYSESAARKRTEFVKNAGYAPEVLDRIQIDDKHEQLRNYAQLTGMFIKSENERIWNTTENNCREFAQDGGAAAAENIVATVKNIRGKYSPELCDALEKKYLNLADVNNLRARIAQGDSIVDPTAQKSHYEAVVRDLESGQYDGLYKAQIAEIVAKLNKGINAQEYKKQLRECSAMFAKDISKMSEKQFDEWEKSTLKEVGAKKHLSAEEKDLWREKISTKRTALQKSFIEAAQAENRNSTLRLLEAARADENGNVDLNYDILHGQSRAEKRGKFNDFGDRFFDNDTIAAYDGDFHSVMSDISAYKNEKDKDGIELRNLLFRTQTFTREHRKMLINALSDKVDGHVPEKWSSESWGAFEAQIDSMIQWYDVESKPADEKKQMAEDSKSVAFYQIRNSICKDVERLGLTPIQAQEYLQKHPFYKRLCDKRSYTDAMDFLNGSLKNPPDTKNQKSMTGMSSIERIGKKVRNMGGF